MGKRKRELHHILDDQFRIKYWPRKSDLRLKALHYLASKLRADYAYTEAAINSLIRHWCAFDDPALLRRELFEKQLVGRMRDGSQYWLLYGLMGN